MPEPTAAAERACEEVAHATVESRYFGFIFLAVLCFGGAFGYSAYVNGGSHRPVATAVGVVVAVVIVLRFHTRLVRREKEVLDSEAEYRSRITELEGLVADLTAQIERLHSRSAR